MIDVSYCNAPIVLHLRCWRNFQDSFCDFNRDSVLSITNYIEESKTLKFVVANEHYDADIIKDLLGKGFLLIQKSQNNVYYATDGRYSMPLFETCANKMSMLQSYISLGDICGKQLDACCLKKVRFSCPFSTTVNVIATGSVVLRPCLRGTLYEFGHISTIDWTFIGNLYKMFSENRWLHPICQQCPVVSYCGGEETCLGHRYLATGFVDYPLEKICARLKKILLARRTR